MCSTATQARELSEVLNEPALDVRTAAALQLPLLLTSRYVRVGVASVILPETRLQAVVVTVRMRCCVQIRRECTADQSFQGSGRSDVKHRSHGLLLRLLHELPPLRR